MRLSATKAPLERRDEIIVCTVSAIYGLGDPNEYFKMVLQMVSGDRNDQLSLISRLTDMQYTRNDTQLRRRTYRASGSVIEQPLAHTVPEAPRRDMYGGEIAKRTL